MRVDRVNRWKAQTVAVLRQVGGTGARGGSLVSQLGHGGRSAAILVLQARAVDGGVLWAAQGRERPPPDAFREAGLCFSDSLDTRAHRFCCQ
jgi:hypothetical protein